MGNGAAPRRMSLRPVPEGRGHPYERDPDQRVPFRPIAGEPVELRVTAPDGLAAVDVELGDGRRLAATSRGSAVPDEDPRHGRTRRAGEGHLSSATSYEGEGRCAWVATVDGLPAGAVLRYRFVAEGGRTDWFECVVCWWENDLLTDGVRSYRSRHVLSLAHGDRVVGFGERFDELDQRG